MAYDDIKDALAVFQNGLKEYQVGRSIRAANEVVQQIRASDIAEEQKRAQLEQVSNNLVQNLASYGTPDTTIESVRRSFVGQTPKNAEELYLQGIQTGNQEQIDMGLKAQKFEMEKFRQQQEILQHKRDFSEELAKQKFEQGKSEEAAKLQTKFENSINPELQVRSPMGRAAITAQQGDKILALIGNDLSPKALDKLPNENIAELSSAVAQMIKSGVPTGEEIKKFERKTLAETQSAVTQYLTSKPQAGGRGELVSLLATAAIREKAVSEMQLHKAILSQANKAKSMVRAHPELEGDIKSVLAQRLNVAPEDVMLNLDSKNPPTTRQQQMFDEKFAAIKKAYGQARMDAARGNPKARQWLLNKGITDKLNNAQAEVLLKHYLWSQQ